MWRQAKLATCALIVCNEALAITDGDGRTLFTEDATAFVSILLRTDAGR